MKLVAPFLFRAAEVFVDLGKRAVDFRLTVSRAVALEGRSCGMAEPVAFEVAAAAHGNRGREIRLPQRFRDSLKPGLERISLEVLQLRLSAKPLPFAIEIRPDRHSSQPYHGSGEMDEAFEVDGSAIVTGGEAPEMLEAAKTSFDLIAMLVDGFVVGG